MKTLKFILLALRRKKGFKKKDYSSYLNFQEFQAEEIIKELKKRKITLNKYDVLELGAGLGGYSRTFKKNSKNLVINDISKPHVIRFDDSIKFKKFDVTKKFPFKDNSFDFIFCCSLIEHIKNPEKMLSEIKRILKPNGYLYLSFPPFYSLVGGHYFKPFHLLGEKTAIRIAKIIKPKMTKNVTSYSNCYGTHGLYRRTIKSVKKMLIDNSFEIKYIWSRFAIINKVKIPLLNEFLTWHVCFLVKNKK